jgi:hypothetical protein
MYVQRNSKARLNKPWCLGKAISVTYSECVSVPLVIQYEKATSCNILSPVASLTVPYFIHIISQRARFSEKKVTEYKMRVLILFTISV